jgi:acyl dehydratase
MAIDKKFIGRKYGPTTYEVGVEKLREFAYAISGGVPSHGWGGEAPAGLHPWLFDAKAAKASPTGGIVGFPGFAVTFSIAPFHQAVTDPEIGINLLMLVHGEQEFEFEEPIKPGDVMTTTGEIVEIYEKANMDFFVVTTESKNQAGKVAVKGRWMAVIRR